MARHAKRSRSFVLIFPVLLALTVLAAASPAVAGTLVGFGDKCADVEGEVAADGTPVILFECNGQSNQQWDFNSLAPFFEVRGLEDKCLQPGDGVSPLGNTLLEIGPCGGLEDRWQPSMSFPDDFDLVHVSTGWCMDVEDFGTANRTPIILFPCNGQANQRWQFDPGPPPPPPLECSPTSTSHCLNGGRFRVEVEWLDFLGATGPGMVLPFTSDDSGLFWFFNSDNWEMLVKVLDGCGFNDRFWVFAAATTDVQYTLKVTDTETGLAREYFNPLGTAAQAITDTDAFATCP